MMDGHGIGMICRNRTGRGGGVAISYNSNTTTLKRYPIVNGVNLEMVAAEGKVRNVNRKFLIIGVYIPLNSVAATVKKMWDAAASTPKEQDRDCTCTGHNSFSTDVQSCSNQIIIRNPFLINFALWHKDSFKANVCSPIGGAATFFD